MSKISTIGSDVKERLAMQYSKTIQKNVIPGFTFPAVARLGLTCLPYRSTWLFMNQTFFHLLTISFQEDKIEVESS